MSYRFIGPLAASLLLLLTTGCIQSPANPTAQADGQAVVRRNLDGSTTQGVELIANYNGKRVLTIQADPMGGALGVGQDMGRGVRSLTTPAQGPHTVAQSLNAPAAFVQRRDACAPGFAPAQQAMPEVTRDAAGNVTHVRVADGWQRVN